MKIRSKRYLIKVILIIIQGNIYGDLLPFDSIARQDVFLQTFNEPENLNLIAFEDSIKFYESFNHRVFIQTNIYSQLCILSIRSN